MKAKTLLCVSLALASTPTYVAVLEAEPNLFVIESTATTKAAPAAVYRALTRVSKWWDPAHTWSGAAKNLSLDPDGAGTKTTLRFRSAGAFTMDTARLAPGVDFVLSGQLKRLATFADGGTPGKQAVQGERVR